MKKLLLIFAILSVSYSSVYAFQETISTGPGPGGTGGSNVGKAVTINANCNYVSFWGSWTGLNSASSGTAQAYSISGPNAGTLIGEAFLWQGSSFNFSIFGYQYWGIVQMYLNAYECYGVATLEWN